MTRYVARSGEMRQDYFQYLCELVGIGSGDKSYWLLAKDLHSREFDAGNIPNDDNRATDGLNLREEYLSSDMYTDADSIDEPCSVLEMLIALARRIDFDLSEPSDDREHTSKYFWEMIDNLGLLDYSDEDYVDRNGMFNVDSILTVFMNRKYKKNGEGGLFPLRCPHADQRKIEIWYQKSAYLMENYEY